jgi:competence protein ComFC
VHRLLHATADLLFPRSCVHCADAIENSPYDFLCASCARELLPCLPPACNTCGYPFYGILAGPRVCPHCAELSPMFDQGKTLFLAKGAGRSLLHELKYRSGFYILKDLHKMVAGTRHYLHYLEGAILVPVPLHPTKQRERGFNQSEKIAQMLAAAVDGRSEVQNLLLRFRYTQTQTRLNQTERHRNVKNAFALAPNTVLFCDQPYILVDDVFTTGSTLNACASVLRDAGAQHVNVVTIGHG